MLDSKKPEAEQPLVASKQETSSDSWKGFFIAVTYGVISTTITFFNKAVFANYQFDGSNTLTFCQGLFSILFLVALKNRKWISFEDFSITRARMLVPLSASFLGMVVTGLAALKFVNVPMYSALRRVTTFIVIAVQYFLMNKTVPWDEFYSVMLMIVGALIAGIGDLTFDLWGYSLTLLNCVVTAVYLVLIAKKSKDTGLNSVGLMFYNNLLSLPVLAIIVLLTEWNTLATFQHWSNPGFHFFFWMSVVQAFLLNYFVFLCSTVNSPLTTSITGQLKAIIQTLLGLITFGGVPITPALSFGLSISTFGGAWYGWIKYYQQIASTRKDDNQIELERIKDKQKGHDSV